MAFHPFEVNAVHLTYTVLGAFVVLFGMFSLFIKERLFVGEAVIATIVGIIAGPYVTGGFDPRSWGNGGSEITNEITLELTRVVIAVSVFGVGVELPKAYMRKHWKSVAFLLGPIFVFGWFVSALLIWGIIPGLSFLSSLVVAACVTPTDPILAQAVIGGKFADKHVPAHLRHILACESGCNDGAAFPLLYIALYLTLEVDDKHAVGEWFYLTWLYEVALGIVLGALLGYAARRLMKFCEAKSLVDRQSFVAQYISLAILIIGITTLLGSDDLLAAFACGTAFAWDGFFNKQTEESNFSNVIDLLFNTTAFIYIGAILPFDSFADSSLTLSVWRLVVLMICIMLLRRLPIMMALYRWMPDVHTFREALFTGHFGPIGVGAIFISTLAASKLPEPHDPPEGQVELLAATIQPIVHFFVLSSVLIHGLSIPFFSLGRRVHTISRTHSIMLTRTNDSRRSEGSGLRRPEPAWLSGVRRILPGDIITINRDDDDDLERGPGDRDERALDHDDRDEKTMSEKRNRRTRMDEIDEDEEKISRENSNSSGSSTMAGSRPGNLALSRTKRVDEDEDEEDDEDSMGSLKTRRREAAYDREGEAREAAESDEERKLEREGRKTPPLRKFREGPHLIVEREVDDGGEVEVEVIRNRYCKQKKRHVDRFRGPEKEVQTELKLYFEHIKEDMEELSHEFKEKFKHLMESIEQAEERHADENEHDEVDSDDEGPSGSRTKSTDWADERHREAGKGQSSRSPVGGQPGRSSQESLPLASSRSKSSAIFIHSRPSGRRRESLHKKIFSRSSGSTRSPPRISISGPMNAHPIDVDIPNALDLRGRMDASTSEAVSARSGSRSPSPILFEDKPTDMSSSKPFPISNQHRRVKSISSRRLSDASSQRASASSGGGLLLNPLSHAGAEDTSMTFRSGYHPDDNVNLTPTVSFSVPEKP
ncbi:na h exchanger 1 [Phaffia rhodozyma]|uniref:Na h exchanger 1 n=1 Tax=Phaffia rhodozyma TaxID=264483 RepID=A0A0F7SX46_PHARH|nr:na h exchanger 1 [Phaffia rhodozyma]